MSSTSQPIFPRWRWAKSAIQLPAARLARKVPTPPVRRRVATLPEVLRVLMVRFQGKVKTFAGFGLGFGIGFGADCPRNSPKTSPERLQLRTTGFSVSARLIWELVGLDWAALLARTRS